MRAVHFALAMVVTLATVGIFQAAEDPKVSETTMPRRPMLERWEMLRGVELTAEQKVQFEAIKQEYGPKMDEARAKMDGILTDEQKKARDGAVRSARVAGRRGPDVWRDAHKAIQLTEDQSAKMTEARSAVAALRKEAHEKVLALLTPEQKEQMKKSREDARGIRVEWGPGMERGCYVGRGPRGVRVAWDTGFSEGSVQCANLTDDQRAQLKALHDEYAPKLQEARQAINSLRKEFREKALALLTSDQKEQLQERHDIPQPESDVK